MDEYGPESLIVKWAAKGQIVWHSGKWWPAGPMSDPRWPFEDMPHD
jgi:hypothetical protein